MPVILPSPSAVPGVTRLRRLAGYVTALDRGRLAARPAGHLGVLDRLKADDRAGAAGLLVRHLDAGRASKARLLPEDSKLRLSAPVPSPPAGGPAGATLDGLGHPDSAA